MRVALLTSTTGWLRGVVLLKRMPWFSVRTFSCSWEFQSSYSRYQIFHGINSPQALSCVISVVGLEISLFSWRSAIRRCTLFCMIFQSKLRMQKRDSGPDIVPRRLLITGLNSFRLTFSKSVQESTAIYTLWGQFLNVSTPNCHIHPRLSWRISCMSFSMISDWGMTSLYRHDWSDEDCIKILKNVEKVMGPSSRLLVRKSQACNIWHWTY